jgi:glycosyltransferase involved in cell wall biosynthesis
MTNKYSCVIPAHNENPRVLEVLRAVQNVQHISEIICIDDGSKDGTGSAISENFPNLKLISHPINLGKAESILDGVKNAHNESVILLDSDLVKLRAEELEKAIHVFEENSLDCLVLHTTPINIVDSFFRLVFRIPICVAGNRIAHKTDIVEAFRIYSPKKYEAEIAFNSYLMEHRKNVGYTAISAIGPSKTSKVGRIKGALGEIGMWSQILFYEGISTPFKQTKFISKNKF